MSILFSATVNLRSTCMISRLKPSYNVQCPVVVMVVAVVLVLVEDYGKGFANLLLYRYPGHNDSW